MSATVAYPSRHGARWENAEVHKALELASSGTTYEKIASTLDRTPKSIELKIASQVSRMSSDEASARDKCAQYKLDWQTYCDYVADQEEIAKYRESLKAYKVKVTQQLNSGMSVTDILAEGGTDLDKKSMDDICAKALIQYERQLQRQAKAEVKLMQKNTQPKGPRKTKATKAAKLVNYDSVFYHQKKVARSIKALNVIERHCADLQHISTTLNLNLEDYTTYATQLREVLSQQYDALLQALETLQRKHLPRK